MYTSIEHKYIQLSPMSLTNIAKLDIKQFYNDDDQTHIYSVRKIYREEQLRVGTGILGYILEI